MAGPLLPPAPRWVQVLSFGLVGVFVVELLLRAAHVPVDILAWFPFGTGFAPWQPVTRLLVQGGDASAVFSTVFGAFILYLSLGNFERKVVAQAMLAAWACGTALALALDAIGVLRPVPAMGWTGLIGPLIVLFGLYRPDGRILLWLVLPISGRLLVWGTLFVSTLVFLAERSLWAASAIGGWAGVYAWWLLLGPGARRRQLRRDARGIERELKRFTVIDGGRGNNRDDGQVH
jgi:hypothetical protein